METREQPYLGSGNTLQPHGAIVDNGALRGEMYGESSTTSLASAWAAGTDSWTLEQRAPRGPHPSFIPDIGGWGKTVNFLGSPRLIAF